MATSPYDRLLGYPSTEEQGATQLVPPPSNLGTSLLPPSMQQTAAPAAAAAPQPPAASLLDPARFLTVGEFYESPGYKSALTPHKKELESQYARTYLTPARMKAAGATQAQQAEASAEFNKRRVKVEKGSMFDNDLLDMPAYGLASTVGGVARVLGLDSLADRAAADAERIKQENFSPETRLKLEEEQYAAQKLAKQYGGEDNVPWWAEAVQGLSNFGRQPLNKTLQALGSSAPALIATMPAAAGGAAVGVGYSLSVLTNALLTAGDSGGGAYDKIMAMPESALQNSIEYVEARANGETHDQARKTVADRAVREAALMAAPLGAAAGVAGLRFGAEGLVAGGKGVIRRTAGEMAQEAVEEGSGQAIENRAVQRADPDQALSTGAFTAAAEGAAAGGGMTLALGALTARRRADEEPPAPATEADTPAAADTPDAPEPPGSAEEAAMRPPTSAWGPIAQQDPEAVAPANFATPAAPDAAAATDDVPASRAIKALFAAGESPEAASAAMATALPEWIRNDTGVARLISDIELTDPDADRDQAATLADDLIGRIAYIQAAESARHAGIENPAEYFAGRDLGDTRQRYLPNFTGRLWRPGVRDAFSRQVRTAQLPGIAARPLPAGVAPLVGEAPLQGTIVEPGNEAMSGAAIPNNPSVRLPDAEVARAAAPTQPALDNDLGAQQPVSPPPAPSPGVGAEGERQSQSQPVEARPRRDAPVPPTPEQLAEQAQDRLIEQAKLAQDLTQEWRVPQRKSRAAKSFDESALTERISAQELADLSQGKPVSALRSIADRNRGTVIGEFAQDLVRTMAGMVKTGAAVEALNTVAARFIPGEPGTRGAIAFNPNQPASTHVVLHEFAHALTAEAIRNPITKAQQLAVQQLQRQMAWVAQNLPANHRARQTMVMGALTNPAEFAAEVYSNPALQNYLKSVPSSAMENARRKTRGNLWDQFIDGVASLMKIRRTALMDTLMTLREIDDGRINKEADAARAAQAPAEQTRSGGRGQPEAAGVPEAASGGSGGDPAAQAPDVGRGPDNPELPSQRADAGDGDGAAGQDPRDPVAYAADPRGNGSAGTVANIAMSVMADLPEQDQAVLLAASAAVGLTPEEMLKEAARYGYEDIKKVDPEFGAVLERATKGMDLFAQSPLLMKAQTVLDSVLSTPAHIRRYEDMIKLGMTGEQPRINTLDNWWSKAREKFVDSTTPFLRALGWDQDSQVWKKYKRGGSKLQEENKLLNEQFAQLNSQVNAFSRQYGLPVAETFAYIDRYTAARYVANGANEELDVRMQEKLTRSIALLTSLQQKIASVKAGNPNNSEQLRALYSRASNLQKIINEANKWRKNYERMNDLVRGRDSDINGTKVEHGPDQKFIGGMTRQEAKEFVAQVNQRFGPAMAEVDGIANAVTGIHRFWSDRALKSGIFFPQEAAQWSHVRFKGGSGDFYTPITGNDNLKDQEDAYAIGGVFYKDFSDEGRNTIGNGAYMSVVHYASSMARRVAYHEFMTELHKVASVENNPYGFVAVPVSQATPGNSRTFLHKVMGSNGVPIVRKIALNNNAASDALVGLNRKEIENSVLKGMSGVTSFFGFMVTQATMMFGPINAFRDFGEKAYTMVSKYGDVDRAKFLSGALAQIGNMANAKAAWDFAFGKENNSHAAKELREFAALGGLNTRTGSINREADKIVSMIQKQSPGFKQAGDLKDAIGKYNEAWEIHSALSTYRALKGAMKGPVDEVAFRMLDSMNFGQSGSASPVLRAFYLFFNPTVQGARNTYNTLLKDIHKNTPDGARRRRVALTTLIGAMVLYAIAREFGGDDEDYGNRTDSLATATVSRNIPLWVGDSYLRIPVPFGAPAVLWNMAVSSLRFASGAMDAPESIMHMLQGAAEHTVPFPISQVDFAENPAFWFFKTITPQYLGPILNIAAGKNDFGNDLVRGTMPGDKGKPEHMLGKRNTDQAWKDLAKTFSDAGVGDFRPEEVKEFLRLGLIGPTEAMAQWALGVQTKDGDHGFIARALGANRVWTNDARGLLRAYYTAEQRTLSMVQQVYGSAGEKPTGFRGDARKAAISGWIAASNLPADEQQVVQLYMDFEDRLKKARGGKSGEEEQEVMRDYLRQYRRILGEN